MTVHVLAGDSLAREFKKTAIAGDVVICRECLIVGDVSSDDLDEFFERRAHFLLVAYATDQIEYHETVADELLKLVDLPAGTEVNLWFEHELFCQVNLWFCLFLLAGSDTEIHIVYPRLITGANRWKGFGDNSSTDLANSYANRVRLTAEDTTLGEQLWRAFAAGDLDELRSLGLSKSSAFPTLSEVTEAAAEMDRRPAEVLREIKGEGIREFDALFAEFTKRAGVYGYGDLQVAELIDKL